MGACTSTRKVTVCYLAVYVDDLILSSNDSGFIKRITDLLATKFKMSSLGDLQSCLGIHVQRNKQRKVMTLSQPRYIFDSAEQLGLKNAKPAATPLPSALKLSAEMSPQTATKKERMLAVPYRKAVGNSYTQTPPAWKWLLLPVPSLSSWRIQGRSIGQVLSESSDT